MLSFSQAFRSAARQRLSLRKTHCLRARMFRDAGKTELAMIERKRATADYGMTRYYLSQALSWERRNIGGGLLD